MGWNTVASGTPLFMHAVLKKCADLLNNSTGVPLPVPQAITPGQLAWRLTPDPGPNRYQEVGETFRRPVFHLYAFAPGSLEDDEVPPADPTTITIALAFHLTLRRQLAGIPTVVDPINSPPASAVVGNHYWL